MSQPLSSVFEQALKLSPEDRARLADELLRSLNADIDPEIEAAWAKESERRRQAILSGEVETVSGSEVIARLRNRRNR